MFYAAPDIDMVAVMGNPIPKYRNADKICSRSRHCPLHKVRVVILGQDPYHGHNQAHGLCFSVRPPTPAPPSLKNIYQAIKKEYPTFSPPPKNGGLLTPWADQGVLLLNTCLTVRAGQANSHAGHGWEKFTQKVIDTVVRLRTRGVVFLAWGSPAQKRCEKISGARHLVLKSVHPSPLSAHKGFFDCGHFRKTNEWLESRYGTEGVINWDLNVQHPIKAPEMNEPVKMTETQKKEPQKDGPATELAEKKETRKNGDNAVGQDDEDDEFDGADDEDAIAAMEEIAQAEADAEEAEAEAEAEAGKKQA
jgi:uracil-DNA glycosylase